MEIGTYLKAYREERSLSQAQLATALNLSKSHVSMLESGKREMGMMVQESLRKRLKTSPAILNQIAQAQLARRKEVKARKDNTKGSNRNG